nr:hypothetical protein BaRGS_027633 [Batillaria attramentaria]
MKYDRQDGIHWLNANGFMVRVFCDQTTDGGGWTVIQRRQDGSEHFFRHWDPYVEGFGDFQGEFWLGLDKIHRLTTVQKQMLRVDLQDFSGQTAYAKYSTFRVAGPSDKYRLTVSGYSGSAGDSLTFHNNQPFSTYDRDNDAQNTNCAVINHGAWWYRNCGNSNLNARYKQSAESGFGGITWLHWKNKYISLKKTEMKIRPAA